MADGGLVGEERQQWGQVGNCWDLISGMLVMPWTPLRCSVRGGVCVHGEVEQGAKMLSVGVKPISGHHL